MGYRLFSCRCLVNVTPLSERIYLLLFTTSIFFPVLTTFLSLHSCRFHILNYFPCLSDHRALTGKINILSIPKRAARWRFNSTLLQNEIFLKEMKEHLGEFIAMNKLSVNDPGILWEALKGCIRDKTIEFASNLNKSRVQHIQKLEKDISEVENMMTLNVTPELVLKRKLLSKDLNHLLTHRAYFLINSGQPSHLLALKLKTNFY